MNDSEIWDAASEAWKAGAVVVKPEWLPHWKLWAALGHPDDLSCDLDELADRFIAENRKPSGGLL